MDNEGDAEDGVSIALDARARDRSDPARPTRVMIGTLSEEGRGRTAVLAAEAPALWQGEIDLDDDEILAAAVYVEDLTSGEWTVEPATVEPAGVEPR